MPLTAVVGQEHLDCGQRLLAVEMPDFFESGVSKVGKHLMAEQWLDFDGWKANDTACDPSGRVPVGSCGDPDHEPGPVASRNEFKRGVSLSIRLLIIIKLFGASVWAPGGSSYCRISLL